MRACQQVLDSCERLVAAVELQLLCPDTFGRTETFLRGRMCVADAPLRELAFGR